MSNPLMGANEDGIPARAIRGDPEALELLVRRNYPKVWRSLYRFTRDRDLADGLSQEAFLRALRGLATFRGQCRLSTWIVRIALNLALNERRRKRPGPLPERRLAAPSAGPVREAQRSEARERVRDAIAGLPEDLSRAILLTFFGGVSHAEAAGILGCAEGTVSWRVHEAKKRIREVLPDEL